MRQCTKTPSEDWDGQPDSEFAKISRKTIKHSHFTVRSDQIIWTKHSKPGNICQSTNERARRISFAIYVHLFLSMREREKEVAERLRNE